MKSLGTTASEIDIRPAARLMLADLGHPFSRGESVFDRVFENVQAGERASHLFRLANASGALVVGTSDLSELAMGYAIYGVGDQMSHYAVNASVPKTLVRYLVEWVIDTQRFEPQVCDALRAILAAPASAELVPSVNERIRTAEEAVGPYELQDFNLY